MQYTVQGSAKFSRWLNFQCMQSVWIQHKVVYMQETLIIGSLDTGELPKQPINLGSSWFNRSYRHELNTSSTMQIALYVALQHVQATEQTTNYPKIPLWFVAVTSDPRRVELSSQWLTDHRGKKTNLKFSLVHKAAASDSHVLNDFRANVKIYD